MPAGSPSGESADILDLDETRVGSDQSTIGTEFVNFLSLIMICRLRKAFYSVPELCGKPFKANMKLLRKGIMMENSEDSEWRPKRLTSKQEKVFMDLGIIEVPDVEPKKRGKPKGVRTGLKCNDFGIRYFRPVVDVEREM